MKNKVFDVILGKRLLFNHPTFQLIDRVRLSSDDKDGEVMTFDKYRHIITNMMKNSQLKELIDVPDQVTSATQNLLSKEVTSITEGDIEKYLSVLRCFSFDLMVVGRVDMTDELVSDDIFPSPKFSYAVENFSSNTAGVSGYYLGYSIDYKEDSIPLAQDYISIFGLDNRELELFELDLSQKSYNVLLNEKRLADFNDDLAKAYLKWRGYKHVVFIV